MLETLGPDTSSTYWAAVAQIVPVLSLALVLEMRRSATRWTPQARAQRRVESAAHLVNGLLLVTTFIAATDPLRGRSPYLSGRTVSTFLVVSLFLLVINPLYYATVRSNVDLIVQADRRVRRLFMRRRRQAIASYRAKLAELRSELVAMEDAVRTSITQARTAAAEVGLLGMTAAEWRVSIIKDEPAPQGRYDALHIGNFARLVDEYDRHPTAELASRLRRFRVWMAHENLAIFRRIETEIGDLEASAALVEARLKTGRLDSVEIMFVEENIKHAGEDFIAMWSSRHPI